MKIICRTTLAAALAAVLTTFAGRLPAQAPPAGAAEIKELRTFYFGNSLMENTMVGLHGRLGASAGKTWDLRGALIHPGVPIWVHAVRQDEPDSLNHKKFYAEGPRTDAIVMLLFAGSGLSFTTGEMWGKERFDPPRDVGDVASCAGIIQHYLKLNPQGKAYVYAPWGFGFTELREVKERIKKEAEEALRAQGAERGEILKKVKERKPTDAEMDPIRKSSDYAASYLTKDYIPEVPSVEVKERYRKYVGVVGKPAGKSKGKAPAPAAAASPATLSALAEAAGVSVEQVRADFALIRLQEKDLGAPDISDRISRYVWGQPFTHSRAHAWAVLEGLKAKFPDLWKQGRLGMIPVGDVFLAVDQQIKAGKVPGLVNVGEFSTDGTHIRSGLPRYTVAATFYAVLFKEHPGKLDWKIYADRANYENKENLAQGKLNMIGGHYVHVPDLGTHVEITEERAQVINDTIWEVVTKHPYTKVDQ
jgi:hypothetical protein